ncbi:hypothetical protein NPIL_571641 [Nephila pilipes]|uniref:Uncharacterized protein n=1 Tax=Nephila pilipes TaxID=299642 RepID=A0A8X6PLV5_NEPPI|nr:hypothetical protein NPIL_571641 [Nephila pilipes]
MKEKKNPPSPLGQTSPVFPTNCVVFPPYVLFVNLWSTPTLVRKWRLFIKKGRTRDTLFQPKEGEQRSPITKRDGNSVRTRITSRGLGPGGGQIESEVRALVGIAITAGGEGHGKGLISHKNDVAATFLRIVLL